MNDVLLEIGKNPRARKLVKSLGLPIPLPEPLARDVGASRERPLADKRVAVGATDGAEIVPVLAESLARAGADAYLAEDALAEAFRAPGETFARPARALAALDERTRIDALVFDATGLADAGALHALYTFFNPLAARIARSGRVLVLARPADGETAERAAAQAAVHGFVKSLAKEIGRVGATANVVVVARGAEARLDGVLRFVLSARSAFVTGQPFFVDAHAKAASEPPVVRPLEKKIALVTGAARGIGAATARALAVDGAKVLCLDRPEDDRATSQLARDLGGVPLLVDLARDGAAAAIAEAVRALGGVDIVVHNAGVTRDKTLARMSDAQWSSVLAINLNAVVKTNAALDAHLKDGARVVCLSSIAGIAGNVGQTAYAASKSGIMAFVAREAARLAPRGITVNAVAPGFIETRLTAAIPLAIREVARRLSALGQGGQPEDVANAIAFLASPGSHGITGRTLRVCGGAFVGA